MADATDRRRREGEALLRQLRRLAARAGAAKAGDRAQLLGLLDDIQTVRRKLSDHCARLDEEMKRAAVRVTAINAYARGARSIRTARGSRN